MDKQDFTNKIRKRVATVAVGSSTTRGRPKETISKVRNQLFSINLNDIKSEKDKNKLEAFLAAETEKMKNISGVDNYGLARKCINLFLRDCFYNKYIYEYYDLSPIESYLELPIDSVVAKKLWKFNKNNAPKWSNLYSLSEESHQKYQTVATEMAGKEGIHRVHLDFLWTEFRKNG